VTEVSVPIETKLVRDGRVILNTYTEPFEIAQVDEMVDRVNRDILDKTSVTIHTISDVTRIKELPPNTLSGARAVNRKRHRMAGYNYLVVKPGLVSSLARALLTVLNNRYFQLTYSVEDALEKIDQALSEEASTRDSTS
jgi:hypothetical protein